MNFLGDIRPISVSSRDSARCSSKLQSLPCELGNDRRSTKQTPNSPCGHLESLRQQSVFLFSLPRRMLSSPNVTSPLAPTSTVDRTRAQVWRSLSNYSHEMSQCVADLLGSLWFVEFTVCGTCFRIAETHSCVILCSRVSARACVCVCCVTRAIIRAYII